MLIMDSIYLGKLRSLKIRRNSPLSYPDVDFGQLGTKWIYESGVHIGILSGDKGLEIVFMVKIRYVHFNILLAV